MQPSLAGEADPSQSDLSAALGRALLSVMVPSSEWVEVRKGVTVQANGQSRAPAKAAMNPARERAIEDLRRIVLETLGARAAEVWLFGSCARGEARQHSDIDIAILPHDRLPSGFFAELAADFEESTIPYDVDLVDLRRADPALVEEVRREGIKWRG